MGISIGGVGGRAGGGSGFALGPAQNTFGDSSTADRSAAETLRDTYATANAAWLALYDGDRSNWIELVWTGNANVVQRRNAAGDAWEDVTPVIRGQRGSTGAAGAQGIYEVEIFRNSATDITTAPTGGTVVVATGVVTAPTDWTITPSAPSAGEDTFRSFARINPSTQTGTVTPVWSVPIDIRADVANADIDARIATWARANSPTGTIPDARIPAAIMRDAEFTAAAVRNLLSLSAAEVNDLLTGASISGQTLTFTQNDGTQETITIPQGAGGMADGVVASGAINPAGTELTLTLSTGGTVVIDIPAILRGGTPPPAHPSLRGGLSADATPTAAELTIVGNMGVLSFGTVSGERLLVARLASEGDISSVLFSFDATSTNQIGGFTKFGSDVDVAGDAYAVWVGNQELTITSAFTATVS